ncbi:MAG: AAA family ATPase, partial [Candidatus Dormibacteraeota bacterium]|nr:AAA family ATPase [Candidatus Dormibacteraeota bacterium]
MPADLIGRQTELRAIHGFLDQVSEGPAALLLEGEAGIGKSTLWQAATAEARRRGYHVLACRPAAAEARLSYAGLADLLADVGRQRIRRLPEPQRRGLEVALMEREPDAVGADVRAIATGLLTVLGMLAEETPVLIAVDDIQSLDRPSGQVVGFAARRLSGPVGLLAAARTGEEATGAAEELLLDPDRTRRLQIGPLTAGPLQQLLRERGGSSLTRPAQLRVAELSGGNPFFALELARTVAPGSTWEANAALRGTPADVVAARLEGLGAHVREALLAVSALADPTVEVVERAVHHNATASLERAEELDLVEIAAGRVRFTHPLLAAGVYGSASAAGRRALHRRLAAVVDAPEERARHLALGALRADEETVAALDQAAG